ncbi:hypothetical protein BN8_02244 [Fibrisoma limi BUZ 3]|uniref:Uncharacterized protein n=1 Tax=Fibrisoma limi BUZ 3 TaxID=1185876 RepID=I2GGZ5_9BACT|nr:hypothetical protein BN8_02244 [Fibrisoma limi BUZ 3]
MVTKPATDLANEAGQQSPLITHSNVCRFIS